MTRDHNLNSFWLHCILDEVVHAGAQDAVLCAGGRSIPLSLAIRSHGGFRHAIPCVDERTGCFMALGLARGTGRPVVVVTTSGSAVANLVPAACEAHALRVPLILLTCDRPRSLRNAGFSQMTDHIGACRAFVAASVDLPDPRADEEAILALREQVSEALAAAVNPETRGIVHINIPLEGMIDAVEAASGWRMPALSSLALSGRHGPGGACLPMRPFSFELPDYARVDDIVCRLALRPGMRGLIVAGPDCSLPSEDIDAFSRITGFPVLADAASGLRRPAVTSLLLPCDALAASRNMDRSAPELVIRLGMEPVSLAVQHYLLQHRCPSIRISTHLIERDYLHPGCEQLIRPGRQDLMKLAELLGAGDGAWLAQWQDAALHAAGARRAAIDSLPWGELKAASLACNAPGFDFLHLANSMAIRNADVVMEPAAMVQRAFSNRGVNGIDGTLGTFIGELIGTRQTGLLLIGDLAFIHDLNALAYSGDVPINGCICIVNNGGGAIFDLLSASRMAGYEETVRNTACIDIEAAARCFGLPYRLAGSEASLKDALEQGAGKGLHVVEARVDPRSMTHNYFALQSVFR